jgi:hypothetical protein
VHSEELHVSNEELRVQSDELQVSEAKEQLKNNFMFSLWELLYNSIFPNNHQRQFSCFP